MTIQGANMPTRKPMVLVVDDDAITCDLISELLELEGYGVQHAEDGGSGLSRLLEGGVDLALVDMRMPGLGGLDVCSRLRARENGQRVPIIMLTALPGEVQPYALAAGADDLLAKPFDID